MRDLIEARKSELEKCTREELLRQLFVILQSDDIALGVIVDMLVEAEMLSVLGAVIVARKDG